MARHGDPSQAFSFTTGAGKPRAAAWCALLSATLLALAACAGPRPAPGLSPAAVHFGPGVVTVTLPDGHPWRALALRDAQGSLLWRQPVPAGQPIRVRFDYDWAPGQRLRLTARHADGAAAPDASLALTAPPRAPAPLEARLQLPSGLDVPGGKAPLLLPAGASGTLALRVTLRQRGPEALEVRLSLPPFVEVAAGGAALHAATEPLAHTLRLALRGQTALLPLRFRVDPRAAGREGRIAWTLEAAGPPVGPPVAHGSQPLRVLAPEALAAGLRLAGGAFPADANGHVLAGRTRDALLLHRPWLAGLERILGLSPPHDPYQPGAYARVTVANGLPGAVQVSVRSEVVRAEDGRPAPAFADPLLGPEAHGVLNTGRVPAGGTLVLAQPVYWDAARLAPGRYQRCDSLYAWGLERPTARRCTPLRAAYSPLAGWLAVWLLMALSLAVFAGALWRVSRWIRRFRTQELVLVALTFALAFLLVSVPNVLLRAGTGLVLGPFAFLVDDLLLKLGLFFLLGTLVALVRKPGVYFLFYGLWMVAQAVLYGQYGPTLLIFPGLAVGLIESGLWLGGLTRGRPAARGAPAWAAAPLVGLCEGLVVFANLQIIIVLYRIYLADWFVLLQAAYAALNATLGLGLGLRLGARLRRMRRPPLNELPGGPLPATSEPAEPAAAPEAGAPLLEVERLGFTYPGAAGPVLDDIGLSLRPGEIVLLGGATGSGKTTLLRLLKGLLPALPGAGLRFCGRDLAAFAPAQWAARCGLLFQEPALQVVRPTVRAELAFGLEVLPPALRPASVASAVEAALARFALEPLAGRELRRLSGGELQRTALASLWVTHPALLLLDEPLAHQDAAARQDFARLLAELSAAGTTVLVAEHRLTSLLDVAHRVLWLEGGRIAWEGTPQAFRRSPHAPPVRPPFAARRAPQPASDAPAEAPSGPGLPVLAGVAFRHGDADAPLFQGMDARLQPGTAVVLAGPNGAGKSTLLAMLAGLHRPSAGAATLDGRPLHRLPWRERARRLGYLPQQADLILQAPTAAAELAATLQAQGVAREEALVRAGAWLERLGLADCAGRFPHLLSRGERQRLALGAVLIHGPQLLLLDEPFAGQGPAHTEVLLALMEDYLCERPGRALIVATHDLEPLHGRFDVLWRLEGGRLTCEPPAAGPNAPSATAPGGAGARRVTPRAAGGEA